MDERKPSLTLKEISPYLLAGFGDRPETEKLKIILELQQGFTADRGKLQRYFTRADMVAAYAYFYLPSYLPKIEFLLQQLSPQMRTQLAQTKLLDFACGPGTLALGISREIPGIKQLYFYDHSSLMLEQAIQLKPLYPSKLKLYASSHWAEIQKQLADSPVTVLLGHAINEMNLDDILKKLAGINVQAWIVIEPGAKEFFPAYLKLREYGLRQQFKVHYPCLQNSSCPKDPQKDWCHQLIIPQLDPELKRLSQLVGINRNYLPMMGLVMAKIAVAYTEKTIARFLRIHKETKFSFMLEICWPKGDKNSVLIFEVNKKSLTKILRKQLQNSNNGYLIEIKITNQLSPELIRGELMQIYKID